MNVRENTCKLISAAEMGEISWEIIAMSALSYLSESEVAEMIKLNELLPTDEDEMEDEDEIENMSHGLHKITYDIHDFLNDIISYDEAEFEEMKECQKFLEERDIK
jgi:hypothetical protein